MTAAATQRSVLHSDICPRNLLLSDDGDLIVGDLGVSIEAGPQGTILKRDITKVGYSHSQLVHQPSLIHQM
jgi:RIO-like serine/threonine protein kinase